MSGSASTLSATSLPPKEAIRFFLGKVNIPTAGWSDVWQEAHARGFMVAGAASQALLEDFRSAIAKAMEQGTTLADFRRDFRQIVDQHGWKHTGRPGWRAQIIYETNLSTAYSAGRYAQLTEPDTLAAFPFWQYVHSGALHPRKQHLAWNGLVLRADDGFWKTHYPPNGWKCGCRVRPLSARDLGRQGKTGPDRAPPVVTHPWVRPSDGQVLQVPDGIDPGFGYNVGEAWLQHAPAIPDDARIAPPAGWVPRLPRGARSDLPPVLERPGASVAQFGTWVDELLATRERSRPVTLAHLPDDLREELGLAARDVVLGDRRFQRVQGKDKRTGRQLGISAEDLARLPELLRRPSAILRQLDNGNLVFVFQPADPLERRLGKIIVGPDRSITIIQGQGSRSAFTVAEVLSAGMTDRANLLDANAYRPLRGKL